MISVFLSDAIRNAYNNVNTVEILDGNVTVVDFDGNTIDIDMNLVEVEVDKLQAEFDSLEYQRSRIKEYPRWEDQLDDIFHNGVDGWKSNIQTIKDKYPKPE